MYFHKTSIDPWNKNISHAEPWNLLQPWNRVDLGVIKTNVWTTTCERVSIVFLRFRLLSDPVLNSPWEKWRAHKPLSSFTNTKVSSLQHFLSSCWENEPDNENWVTRVSWTETNNMSWGKRENSDLEFSFGFSVAVLNYLFAVHLHSWSSVARLFLELTPIWRP